MRIVIIDDEINCRIVLRDRIAKLNSSCKIVGEASGVESGISLIEQEKPDLVFLDIQMDQLTLEYSIKVSNMDKDITSHQVVTSTMGNG